MAESERGGGPDGPPDPVASGAPPASRRLRPLLAASLALNLLFLGMMAGAFFAHGGSRPGMGRELAFGPFTDALTRDDRAALREALAARVPDMRSLRQGRQEELGEMVAELRREPFDRGRLDQAFDRLHQRLEARMDLGRALLADRIAAMTPAERAAFVDRLLYRLNRPGGKPGP
ncbi:MAG: periplasmic heavy metal sensor [Paracoccaceae bacterium]